MLFQITIKFESVTSKMEVSGPVDDMVLFLGMLEAAKNVVNLKSQMIVPCEINVKGGN